jgi:uncharacterized protein (TIGR03435 family)
LTEERFATSAKLPAGASKIPVPEMLQTMPAARFKLTIHNEQKVRPVYVLAQGNGPLKLREPAGGADPAQQGCSGNVAAIMPARI